MEKKFSKLSDDAKKVVECVRKSSVGIGLASVACGVAMENALDSFAAGNCKLGVLNAVFSVLSARVATRVENKAVKHIENKISDIENKNNT